MIHETVRRKTAFLARVSRATVRHNHSVLRFTRKSGVSTIAAGTFMNNASYAPAFLDIAYPIT
jgi:hypothetical protein